MENRKTMGKVLAVCVSEKKGTIKHPVPKIVLRTKHGIEGDAHAGDWHRQVSLLATESIEPMREKLREKETGKQDPLLSLPAGAFAENILTEGIELKSLTVGTRLQVGGAVLRVTQIGKECHADCAIRRAVGDCVMPREGIFAIVEQDGTVRTGDAISIL
jgi:MOSC domain-containing protein YiiM